MNMEARVERYRSHYLVTTMEDLYIKVSKLQVESIAEELPDIEQKEIAILLATIKQSRIIYGRKNAYKKVEEEKETEAIIKLLQSYDTDTLSSLFEEMKYYEIKKVLEAANPIKVLRELN